MLTRYRRNAPTTSSNTVYRDPFYSFVDRFFNEFAGSDASLSNASAGSWVPAMDIIETENAFVATADLPGMTKDDIDVSLEDGVLTVSGERHFETTDEGDGKFRRIERSYGRFTRSFSVPQGIDQEKLTATFENGVLTLTLPKSEIAKSRKIQIS
ncbi:MAG: Hsp20/alpha crystallin family protein [Acidobacteriota bacterium]